MRIVKVLIAFLPVVVQAAIPLSRQHPLIARVNQPYSWTISPSTFDNTNFSSIFLRTSPGWLIYDNATSTFRGTPTPKDIGITTVRIYNQFGDSDRFQLYVSDLPPPIVNIPLETQLVPGNPSISSVFTFPAPSIGVRVPPKWSFSIGFDGFTFITPDERNVYYDATLADGLPLPDWIVFNNRTLTFDGVAPTNRSPKLSIILHGSDRWGFGAIQARFDLVIGPRTHLLGVDGTTGLETINVTGRTPFAHSIKTFGGLTIDGIPVVAANISRVEVNVSTVPWLVFNNLTRVLSGVPPLSAIGTNLVFPVSITSDYNDTVDTSIKLSVLPSCFSSMPIQPVAVTTGTFMTFSLKEYITGGPSTSATIITEYNPRTASSWLSYDGSNGTLSGIVPKSTGYNEVNVTFSATDSETHAISTTSLVLSISPNATFGPEVWEDRHGHGVGHRAKTAVLVTFSVIGGAIFVCCLLALCRRCCAVRDPCEDDENASQWKGRGVVRVGAHCAGQMEKSVRSVELGRASGETTVGLEGGYKLTSSEIFPPQIHGSNPGRKAIDGKGVGIFQRLSAASKWKLQDHSLGSQLGRVRRSQISCPVLIDDNRMLGFTENVFLEGKRRSNGSEQDLVQHGRQCLSGVPNHVPSFERPGTKPEAHGRLLSRESSTQIMYDHTSRSFSESDESSLTSIPRRRSDFLPPRDQRVDGSEQPRPSTAGPAHFIRPSVSSETIGNEPREAAVIATAARQVLPSIVSTTSVEHPAIRSSMDSTGSQSKDMTVPSSPGSLSITGVGRPRLVQLNSEKRVLASNEGASTSRNRSQKAVINNLSRASEGNNEPNQLHQDRRLSLGVRYVPSLDDGIDIGSAVFYMTPSVGTAPSPVTGPGKSPTLLGECIGPPKAIIHSLNPDVNNTAPIRTSSRCSKIPIGTPFAISVPFEIIPSRGAEISVRQQNGKPVPAWINLDQRDVELWGVPLKEHLGTHLLEILEGTKEGQRVVARMSLEVVQWE
ncbi:Dystroglycan-type cadherin-like domain protein, partial [Rhizoctonia solani]